MHWFRTFSILYLLLVFTFNHINAQELSKESTRFTFKLHNNEVLTVDKYQDIRINNGYSWQTREEKNRIILKVKQEDERGTSLLGNFITYSRSPRRIGSFRLNKTYKSSFLIQKNGRYLVTDQFNMPNLRSLPTFPDYALKKNDTWKAPAQEYLNIANMHILIPVKVDYIYKGIQELKLPNIIKRNLHRIEYKYNFNVPVKKRNSPIHRISGFTTCVLWFDNKSGVPVYDTSRLVYDFHLQGGAHQEFRYQIQSWYNKKIQIKDIQKDQIVNNIKNNLRTTQKNKTVSVRKNKKGIVLELSDILFAHNQSNLTHKAQSSIKKIAEILKKHPHKEIRILGHTDSSGNPTYNKNLSMRRANPS